MPPSFRICASQDVETAVGLWADAIAERYDDTFGLCVADDYATNRWTPRCDPPLTDRGLHSVSQDSTYYALALLRLDRERERALTILNRVLEARIMDPSSHRYGQFKLIYEATGFDVLDGNTTFFVSIGLIPILKEYAEKIGADLAGEIVSALGLIGPAEHRFNLDMGFSYTNREMGHCATWLIAADVAGDGQRYQVAKNHFEEVYEVNFSRGIPERLSMTYYMVNIISMSMILKYLDDEPVRKMARDFLDVFLKELLFFEDRQPVPARRTYNQNVGECLKWSPIDWLMGALPDDDGGVEAMCRRFGHFGADGFLNEGGWFALAEAALRDVVDPASYALPAPRQMRGKFVDEDGYTSYFHKDFTIGTFDRWQIRTVGKQHESDIPVSFGGATGDLVFFGAYSIDGDDTLQTHPGTGAVGTPSDTTLPRLHYLAAQHRGSCLLLSNITGMACSLKEYGWWLCGRIFGGRLIDAEGNELNGEGVTESPWVFLVTDDYFAGIRPLEHFNPTADVLDTFPTPVRYAMDTSKMALFAPNFRVEETLRLVGDNLPAGAILTLGSARDTSLDAFRETCLDAVIKDEWFLDGYYVRNGYRDAERRIGLSMPGVELTLTYDYLVDRVLSKTVNGQEIVTPDALCEIERLPNGR